ncbi:serine-rich adhesin for platelets-like [Leptopilina heterotoma]|uniref:serine-rich adhesin for platelets-like n=1 Tax=Leptopilina heterotoma TaxID=63436 RepID=UPI001CA8A3A2|nr:serine-rich adhesin for platelets-like [Leptopilina heterotoma]
MSDAEKTDMPSDTQDTFFEESESNSQFANNTVNTSNCTAESQDFHLLDTGDSQELDLPMNDSEVVSIVKENDNTEKIMENENSTSKEESIVEQTEEDEDIVHGTPPPCFSPSKKLSALADKSLKRRADFSEDSCENLPKIKRNKIEDELELMESDTTDVKNSEQKCDQSECVIIPETQESTQDCSEKNLEAGLENSLEEECDLVNEAIDSVNDGDENQNDSTVANFANNDVSNQNENSLLKDLNESKEIDFSDNFTENGDEKKDFNKTDDDTNLEKELSKIVEITDDTTNNIEKLTTPEENDTKCEINELEKANSIEDALKQLGGECDSTLSSKPIIEKESTESELLAVLTDSDTNAEIDEVTDGKQLPTSMEIDEKSENEKKPNEQNEQIVKSRMSIEVIYDRSSLSQEIKARPSEIVEIDDDDDDDDDKIVIDSSQDESKIPEIKDDDDNKKVEKKESELQDNKPIVKDNLKVENTLINGGDIEGDDLDTTASLKSDSETKEKLPKVFVVSDSEGDSMLENKSTSESHVTLTAPTKTQQIEKEFVISVRLKCLITIDESTKDVLNKELLAVNCEISNDQIRNSDTSTSLADISGNDNKDGSPGSVTSATYPRFSIMSTSTISSSTSSSSSGSVATKLTNDKLFSIPKGKAKHTKKFHPIDGKSSLELEQLGKEWKNSHLISTSILNFLSTDVNIFELQNGVDMIDEKIRSSTPEAEETPQRSLKKGRPPKRLQTRTTRKRTKIIATTKTSPNVVEPITEDSDESFAIKDNKTKAGFSTPVKKSLEGLRNSSFAVDQPDELLGKQVFAKWSDNNYYAGHVMDKNKTKYKVNFLDGKSKQLIAEFIIPISETFGNGLSVYTLTKDGDYGPCGMIVDIVETNNKVSYVVEPDEGKKITVQIKDIFLTPDQAQVLKEELWSEQKSLPSTPHSITQVTLDNMVDGKRRSRRNTSTAPTPKSKKSLTNLINKTTEDEPSVSGVVSKSKEAEKDKDVDKDGKTSDSNCSIIDENGVHGVQKEIPGTANEQITTKGPQSRIKGKQRNRKKSDDQETIDLLGPIPEANSKIFDGMSFVLTCASVESIDRYNVDNGTDSNSSEVGTENEEVWNGRPFVRERLEQQIVAGGGKVYESFDLIPVSEYESTKLITNLPNLTAKSLLCLSVGISAYNHMWVIRSCQNNKPVNPSEEKLPAGWSIDRRSYVEMFNRRDQKPLMHTIVVIPYQEECDKEFVSFWSRICENAGGNVRVVDNPEISFIEGTVVLTNYRCPLWVVEKARGWEIPLVSTTWVVQSLIEGKILTYDGHKRFKPF